MGGKGASRSLGAVEEWTQEGAEDSGVKELSSVEAGRMSARAWDLCEVSVGEAERSSVCAGNEEESETGTGGVVWRTVMSQKKRKEERRKMVAQLEKSRMEKKGEVVCPEKGGRWKPREIPVLGDRKRKVEDPRVRDEGSEMRVELEPRFVGAVEREAEVLGMTFQVAAVKKALAAVWRICRAGNVVQFGEAEEDCYIKHKETGRRVMLKKKGGSYVLRVEFVRRKVVDGEERWESLGREEVTVDSGAEESVCPRAWGEGFGMVAVAPGCELMMIKCRWGGDEPLR